MPRLAVPIAHAIASAKAAARRAKRDELVVRASRFGRFGIRSRYGLDGDDLLPSYRRSDVIYVVTPGGELLTPEQARTRVA